MNINEIDEQIIDNDYIEIIENEFHIYKESDENELINNKFVENEANKESTVSETSDNQNCLIDCDKTDCLTPNKSCDTVVTHSPPNHHSLLPKAKNKYFLSKQLNTTSYCHKKLNSVIKYGTFDEYYDKKLINGKYLFKCLWNNCGYKVWSYRCHARRHVYERHIRKTHSSCGQNVKICSSVASNEKRNETLNRYTRQCVDNQRPKCCVFKCKFKDCQFLTKSISSNRIHKHIRDTHITDVRSNEPKLAKPISDSNENAIKVSDTDNDVHTTDNNCNASENIRNDLLINGAVKSCERINEDLNSDTDNDFSDELIYNLLNINNERITDETHYRRIIINSKEWFICKHNKCETTVDCFKTIILHIQQNHLRNDTLVNSNDNDLNCVKDSENDSLKGKINTRFSELLVTRSKQNDLINDDNSISINSKDKFCVSTNESNELQNRIKNKLKDALNVKKKLSPRKSKLLANFIIKDGIKANKKFKRVNANRNSEVKSELNDRKFNKFLKTLKRTDLLSNKYELNEINERIDKNSENGENLITDSFQQLVSKRKRIKKMDVVPEEAKSAKVLTRAMNRKVKRKITKLDEKITEPKVSERNRIKKIKMMTTDENRSNEIAGKKLNKVEKAKNLKKATQLNGKSTASKSSTISKNKADGNSLNEIRSNVHKQKISVEKVKENNKKTKALQKIIELNDVKSGKTSRKVKKFKTLNKKSTKTSPKLIDSTDIKRRKIKYTNCHKKVKPTFGNKSSNEDNKLRTYQLISKAIEKEWKQENRKITRGTILNQISDTPNKKEVNAMNRPIKIETQISKKKLNLNKKINSAKEKKEINNEVQSENVVKKKNKDLKTGDNISNVDHDFNHFIKVILSDAENMFICTYDEECIYSTSKINAINRHINTNHLDSKKLKCDKCKKTFKSENRFTAKRIKNNKVFRCDYKKCTFVSKRLDNIKKHVHNKHYCEISKSEKYAQSIEECIKTGMTITATPVSDIRFECQNENCDFVCTEISSWFKHKTRCSIKVSTFNSTKRRKSGATLLGYTYRENTETTMNLKNTKNNSNQLNNSKCDQKITKKRKSNSTENELKLNPKLKKSDTKKVKKQKMIDESKQKSRRKRVNI